MIAGNPFIFAIESEISVAYERLSRRALGFFAIHVGGRCYGIRTWDATALSAAFDGVVKRIARRGGHKAPAISGADAEAIVTAYIRAEYIDHDEEELFHGMRDGQFNNLIQLTGISWAPDGEEGFDDGSHVLQFDIGNSVRLIAFTRRSSPLLDPGSLRDVWLESKVFYDILQDWHDRFKAEWESLPKADNTIPFLQ
jgi:hypothetical protein